MWAGSRKSAEGHVASRQSFQSIVLSRRARPDIGGPWLIHVDHIQSITLSTTQVDSVQVGSVQVGSVQVDRRRKGTRN